MRDTQADVPSAGWRRAQLAFKDSMVHGILQFTPSIAFRYVLHRCESRDIRCRESFGLRTTKVLRVPVRHSVSGAIRDARGPSIFLGASRAGVCLVSRTGQARTGGEPTAVRQNPPSRPRPELEVDGRSECTHTPPCQDVRVQRSLFRVGFDNDPSAGSPTETLLRLLLPLNDKVQWTSRDVAGSEPPTSPRSEHFTGPFNR